jgi:hypothetical protein
MQPWLVAIHRAHSNEQLGRPGYLGTNALPQDVTRLCKVPWLGDKAALLDLKPDKLTTRPLCLDTRPSDLDGLVSKQLDLDHANMSVFNSTAATDRIVCHICAKTRHQVWLAHKQLSFSIWSCQYWYRISEFENIIMKSVKLRALAQLLQAVMTDYVTTGVS